MKLLRFELTGEMALWRNVYDSIGAYSCLGPAPSHLAGLLGAALGFASPRSHAFAGQESKTLKAAEKRGLLWPVSPELLKWEAEQDFRVACRWMGGIPRRSGWNVNGCKEIAKWENLRMQQQVIMDPKYEVAVALRDEAELERLACALRQPAFPLYLGTSFCRAFIRNCRMTDRRPDGAEANWAYRAEKAALGESTPFSLHDIHAEETAERLSIKGYWIYPTPELPGIRLEDPLVVGYAG